MSLLFPHGVQQMHHSEKLYTIQPSAIVVYNFSACCTQKTIVMVSYFHWQIQRGTASAFPLTGASSFVFAFVFAKKHMHWRSAPLLNGKSWICH